MFRSLLPLLLATAITAGEARLLWSLPSGSGVDAINDLLVTADQVLIQRDKSVICLDPATGTERWRHAFGSAEWPFALGFSASEDQCGVLLRAHDGKLVVQLPNWVGQYDRWGLAVLSLKDGAVLSESELSGQFGPAGQGTAFHGSPLFIWQSKTSSGAFDLDAYANRFELPAEHALGRGETVPMPDGRLLTIDKNQVRVIDPAAGTVRRLPLRRSPGRKVEPILLGDGGFLLGTEGRFGPDLSYQGPSPWPMGLCRRLGDALYVRTAADLRRVDPATLVTRWSLPLRQSGQFIGTLHGASDGSILAWTEASIVALVDATTGKLLLVLPTPRRSEVQTWRLMHRPTVGLVGSRLFVRTPSALTAWSCAPSVAGDASDPAEPAWRIAACRTALAKQAWDEALDSLSGLALAVRLRPEARAEAALLFSQLQRSPIPTKLAERWRQVVDSEGVVAPELFRADWVARADGDESAASALIEVGDPAALAAAMPWMEQRRLGVRFTAATVAAAEQRFGADKTLAAIIACGPEVDPDVLSLLSLSPERMLAALPKLTNTGGDNRIDTAAHLPPEVAIAMLAGLTEPRAVEIRAAAEAQLASRTAPPKAEPMAGSAPAPKKKDF